MDTSALQVFREIARLGSFTAAGRALGYTQSAVSRQVSGLERELDVTLFDRLARGTRLTAAGDCLLSHATVALDRLDAARLELGDLRSLRAGRLRVGAFPNANAALIPRAMAAFKDRHPDVSLALTEGSTSAHLAGLAAGEIDLAVVTTPWRDDDAPRVDLHPLAEDPLFVALPRAHRMAHRRTIRLADLAEETWIAGTTLVDDTLLGEGRRADFRPRIQLVAADWVAKLGLVAAGLGVTAVPWLAAHAGRTDVRFVALHRDDVSPRVVAAATPHGSTVPPPTAVFLEILVETAGEMRRRRP
ncbi:MAG: LysR family transcriptional regulator [Streptosporangiales bacterium]|nr:LysR family transcriptional regulator [Streptosporangiales bacterium]